MDVQNAVTFQYAAPTSSGTVAALDAQSVARAVTTAFHAQPLPGSLKLTLPTCPQAASVDPAFRVFAARLLKLAPGLPFVVFGGASDFSRELLLSLLPNLEGAADSNRQIVVRYDALEAQTILHEQFTAMMDRGISEADIIGEMTSLSRNVGMGESAWA